VNDTLDQLVRSPIWASKNNEFDTGYQPNLHSQQGAKNNAMVRKAGHTTDLNSLRRDATATPPRPSAVSIRGDAPSLPGASGAMIGALAATSAKLIAWQPSSLGRRPATGRIG